MMICCATAALAQPGNGEEAGTAVSDPVMQLELSREHSLEELQLLVAPLTLDQLTDEAAKWQGYLQTEMSRIAVLKVAAMNAEGEVLDRIHSEINVVGDQRAALIYKFQIIVDSLELKGGDPELVTQYRQYVTGALAAEFDATDLKTILSQAIDWAISTEGGVGFILSFASIIGSFFILLIIARFIRSLASRGIRRITHLSQLMQDFLLKVTFWLAFAIGLMIVLAIFGVNITPSVRRTRRRQLHPGFRHAGNSRQSRFRPHDHDQQAVRRGRPGGHQRNSWRSRSGQHRIDHRSNAG